MPLFGDDLIGRSATTRSPEAVRQTYETHDVAELLVTIGVSDVNTGDVVLDHGGA